MTLQEAKDILLNNKIITPLTKGDVGFKVNPSLIRHNIPLEEKLSEYPELCKYLLTFPSIKEGLYRCYHLLDKTPTCKYCGEDLYFTKVKYSRTCGSKECVFKLNLESKLKNNPEDPYNTKKQKETAKNKTAEQQAAIIEKRKKTKLEKYGDANYNNSEKNKETCLKKYGVTNPSLVQEFKDKRTQTNLEKFGETSVFKTDKFKEELKKNNLEKYGTEYASQSGTVKNKMKQTCLEKYGVEYAFQAEKVKTHIKQALESRTPEQIAATVEKTEKTNLEKYGVKCVLSSPKIKDKARKTIEKKVEEDPEYWKKIKEKGLSTLKEKYGSLEKYYEVIQAKTRDTLIKNYSSLEKCYEERCKKAKESSYQKYGVAHYRNTEEYRERDREIREAQYSKFREENPTVIPLFELEETNKEFFESHGVNKNREPILIRESIEALGYEIKDYNFGNGDVSKHFPGIDLNSKPIEEFLEVFKDTLKIKFKEFIAGAYRSKGEKEVYDYVKSIVTDEVYYQSRGIIKNPNNDKHLELDIYIPSKKIAIEYNGSYWHSRCDKNYHLNKTLACEELGIRLIHIWDYEWIYQQDLIKRFLKNLLTPKIKIGARKCVVKEVELKEEKEFLNTYHLQGYQKSMICYGLYYKGELLQLMSFSKSRYRKSVPYELLRLCTKEGYTIIGGSNKLLREFEKEYSPSSIVSYCNRDKFEGQVYTQLGFEAEKLKPTAFYVKLKESSYSRFSASSLAKVGADKLIGTCDGKGSNNEEIALREGYFKLWSTGQQTYVKTIEK